MAKVPAKVGKYKIVSLIAEGGMGAVYKGIHPTLKRYVILKKLTLKGSAAITERFKREARLMMDFKNDLIVDVYDHFKEDQSYYIVLEYIDGKPLDELIKRYSPLPDDIAAFIFLDSCRALKYAHDKKVVHRDIKPANILISKNGEIKLVDFGIATSKKEQDDGLTKDGMTLGTPSYMPPEQFLDTKSVDKRADIYSMGVMLYEMLSGKKPFPGNFSPESIALIQQGRYTSIKKVNPEAAPILTKIIKKCIRPKPGQRYQDLDKVIRILDSYLKKRKDTARIQLIDCIKGKKIKEIGTPKFKKLKSLFMAAVVSIAVVGCGVFLFNKLGYNYEILKSNDYGSLVLTVKIERGSKTAEDIYISARIFRDDNKIIPEVKNIDFVFKENKKLGDKECLILESQKIYLKTDHYRVKASIENQISWNSFFLNPRSVQRKNKSTMRARILNIKSIKTPPLPLTVNYCVLDHKTGEDITKGSEFYYFNNGKWNVWTKRSIILTGNAKSAFKFVKKGYYDRVFKLLIKEYQSLLDIETTLVPIPGTVNITSDRNSVALLLNGSRDYMSGGLSGLNKKIIPASKKNQRLILSPGTYELAAGPYRGKKKAISFKVVPNGITNIFINYDKKNKVLNITR